MKKVKLQSNWLFNGFEVSPLGFTSASEYSLKPCNNWIFNGFEALPLGFTSASEYSLIPSFC